MNKKDKLMKRIKEDYYLVDNMGYEVLGVFLQGSQNYNLDHSESDIDTKAIIIPKFEDFLFGKKMVSTTHVLDTEEHVDLKDVRLMWATGFLKMNINFLEILFTEYFYINPKYIDLFQIMFDNNERIARYDKHRALDAMAGMCYEKKKALCHPYPAKKHIIDEFGMDGKQLHHIIRIHEFANRYIDGEKFSDCLISKDRDYLINLKTKHDYYELDIAKELADNTTEIVKETKNKYKEENEKVLDEEVKEIMNDVLTEIIKRAFREELLSE